jgi:DNA excision repair protein ERCC-4
LSGIENVLIANIREKESKLIPLLEKEGVMLKFTSLKLVDFIAAGKIAIVKRTMDEFVAELQNKMVYRTAIELKRDFPDPLYIVEGKQTTDVSSATTIRVGITYLTVLNRIPIIFTNNEEDTARYISLLLKQSEFSSERETPQPQAPVEIEQPQPSEGNFQEQILAKIPGLSPANVKTLMDTFGNLKSVFGASEEKLKAIKSIGPKKAKAIIAAFQAPFHARPPAHRNSRRQHVRHS